MDKSRGRVQLINGDIFYSPNSKRTVVPLDEVSTNPFLPDTPFGRRPNYWTIDTSTYEQPRWHSSTWGWIAFYNKDTLSTPSALFRTLQYSNVQPASEPYTGFIMARWQMDEWLRLDQQLRHGYNLLRRYYEIPMISTHEPVYLGYNKPHKHYGTTLKCIEKSRKWFVVYLALWSCAIAGAETRETQLEDTRWSRENWKRQLVTNCKDIGIDQGWIDLLLDSPVASFSDSIERTGTFLKVKDGSITQPDPTWFYMYGVPVWYPWDRDLASNLAYGYLAPLPEQLQEATTLLLKSPSPPTTPLSSSVLLPPFDSQTPPATHPRTRQPPSTAKMEEFFRLRAERNARTLARETPGQRIVRLSREKNPPTVSARVFEWIVCQDDEYICEEVSRKDRGDVLGSYTNDETRYDAFANEWHICKLWGDHIQDDGSGDESSDESGDESDDYDPSFGWNESQTAESNVGNLRPADEDLLQGDAWVVTSQQAEQRITLADKLEGEILNVAELYFGYTPCIPLPQVTPLQDERARKSFCRSFGLVWAGKVESIQDVFERPAVSGVTDFFRRLAQRNSIISKDEWDLLPGNRQAVKLTSRFPKFHIVFSEHDNKQGGGKALTKYYMLDLASQRTAPWNVAVKHASDALTICRLDPSFNEYEIVDFLLTNGIQFHTFQPSSSITRTLNMPRPSLQLLTRNSDYKFDGRDYLAYRERCRAILDQPRGRAALMYGNIMWRIAIHTVKWEAVYAGPSGSPDPYEMVVVRDTTNGIEYVDDDLSPQEQEALCGTYCCFTGVLHFPSSFLMHPNKRENPLQEWDHNLR